jgi:nucleoside-triphosphatase
MMKKRLLLLTGNPGVGKTTVMLRIVEALRARNHTVGGMISREVRSGGNRVGFEILNLSDGQRGWLAHVDETTGPRIGKYHVNLKDLDALGAGAVTKALENFEVIVIDEIGPMELCSEKFAEAVRRAIESGKLVVAVIHAKAGNKIVDEVRNREDAEVFLITKENRSELHKVVIEEAEKSLEKTDGKKGL